MKRKLLIVGAGNYGMVAKEVAQSMCCFDRIDFIDSKKKRTIDGTSVIGTLDDMPSFSMEYTDVVVAIGDASVRKAILEQIKNEKLLHLATLISPRAYVSATAQIGDGCIIEPMAVVHVGAVLGTGCLICAGAVVNHGSICGDIVQLDCNATIMGNTIVSDGVKIAAGTVYENKQYHS